MKVTRDEIKALDIRGYVTYLVNLPKETRLNCSLLALYSEQQKEIALKKWNWFCYFVQNDKKSIWEERFNKAADAKIEDLQKKIEECKQNARNSIFFLIGKPNIKDFELVFENPLKLIDNIDWDKFINNAKVGEIYFNSSIEDDKTNIEKGKRFNSNIILDKIKDFENKDFEFVEFIKENKICPQCYNDDNIVNSNSVICEFADLEIYKYCVLEQEKAQLEATRSNFVRPKKTLTKTQFAELVKALIESGTIQYESQKEAVENLAAAFGVEITNAEFSNFLNGIIQKRNNDIPAKFLDELKQAFINWKDTRTNKKN